MSELDRVVTFKVDVDTFTKLKKIARKERRKVSDIVREAVVRYLWMYITEYDLQRVRLGRHAG